jgi:hypothetical protein
MELSMAVAIELTRAAQHDHPPATSELDDITPLRAASTAEASEIPEHIDPGSVQR